MEKFWSTHREALEKLQLMLKNFDMSFGTSNKLFRVAIVMEILNVQCLFEQLYAKWQEDLPWGMDADADINFSEWAGYQTWADLISSARQNICIDNIPVDLGNNNSASDIAKFVKKGFNKSLKAVFKSSFSNNWQGVLEPYIALTSDKESVLSYGEMVYYAIEQLRSTLHNIDRLLQNPSDAQLLSFYNAIDQKCYGAWHPIEGKIADIHRSDIPQKKKENNLKAYRDELINDLIRSKVLDEKLEHCNNYDVKDFMSEHKDEYSEEYARVIVTIEEFGDLSKDATKINIARYLFEQRHDFPVPRIYQLFVFLHGFPLVNKHLQYVTADKTERRRKEPVQQDRTYITFTMSGITVGHIDLLRRKLIQVGWIAKDTLPDDFYKLFSGKTNSTKITWTGAVGKGMLRFLFQKMVDQGEIVVPDNHSITTILESHFVDEDGIYISGLNSSKESSKHFPIVKECLNILQLEVDND